MLTLKSNRNDEIVERGQSGTSREIFVQIRPWVKADQIVDEKTSGSAVHQAMLFCHGNDSDNRFETQPVRLSSRSNSESIKSLQCQTMDYPLN